MRPLSVVVVALLFVISSVYGITTRPHFLPNLRTGDRLMKGAARPEYVSADSTSSELESLISDLTDEELATRKNAERELERLGPAAVVRLAKENAAGEDLESRRRAEQVLKRILAKRATTLSPEQYLCILAYSFTEALGRADAIKQKKELLRAGELISRELPWEGYGRAIRAPRAVLEKAVREWMANRDSDWLRGKMYGARESLDRAASDALKVVARRLGDSMQVSSEDEKRVRVGLKSYYVFPVRRVALPSVTNVSGLGSVELVDEITVDIKYVTAEKGKTILSYSANGHRYPILRPYFHSPPFSGIPSATSPGELALVLFEEGFPKQKPIAPALRNRMKEVCGETFE